MVIRLTLELTQVAVPVLGCSLAWKSLQPVGTLDANLSGPTAHLDKLNYWKFMVYQPVVVAGKGNLLVGAHRTAVGFQTWGGSEGGGG
jgi:hypothetical protein